ncbi:MAG: hypothetical protein ACRDDY_03715 [Clostridium sp.]|uniref:hypothetical protein n=1 Tax=Clostridium sp. TaxID=1506 RepID=UPI003EE7505B
MAKITRDKFLEEAGNIKGVKHIEFSGGSYKIELEDGWWFIKPFDGKYSNYEWCYIKTMESCKLQLETMHYVGDKDIKEYADLIKIQYEINKSKWTCNYEIKRAEESIKSNKKRLEELDIELNDIENKLKSL